MPRSRTPERRPIVPVGRVLFACTLGLASCLAIAWTGLGFGPTAAAVETRSRSAEGHDWLVRVWRSPAADVGVVSLEMPAASPAVTGMEFDSEFFRSLPHRSWCVMMRHSAARASAGCFWELRAFGWPRRCVAAGYLALPGGGKPIGLSWIETGGTPRLTLAAHPRWGGLLVNTLVLAVPWLVLLSGAGAATRRLVGLVRQRRGCCPRCGYDVKGISGCPECGWKR